MRRWFGILDVRDMLVLVGGALVVYGLAQVYVPAAFIAPGLGLIGLAVWRVK